MRTQTRLAAILIAILVTLAWASNATADRREYILIVDRELGSTNATGICLTLTWTPRVLNSIDHDDTGQVLLANSRFVLPGGTYEIRGRDFRDGVTAHRSRLQKFPGDVTILMGSSEQGGEASVLEGKFTIAQPASFEFQSFCSQESGNIPPFVNLDDNILGFVQLYRVTNPNTLAAGHREFSVRFGSTLE